MGLEKCQWSTFADSRLGQELFIKMKCSVVSKVIYAEMMGQTKILILNINIKYNIKYNIIFNIIFNTDLSHLVENTAIIYSFWT